MEGTSNSSALPSSSKDSTVYKRAIHPTIEIINGYKDVGYWQNRRLILNNLNMTVYEGEVYTLLGPQSCGKSTVLGVILGFTKLTTGTVKVFGFDPGHELSGIPGIRVGYIPKSKGLYQEFTVNETLYYYGKLLGLKKEYITERIYFLINLLKLPNDQHYVKYYNEGIQKQISFAIALLHEPELLILDEPCDGLDPKLTRSMWEYMKMLCRQDKTILTTTQTCDEARWSDRLGLINNGQVLLEGNPKELLTKYKEKTLERLYCRAYITDPQLIQTSVEVDNVPSALLNVHRSSSEGFLYSGVDNNMTRPKHENLPQQVRRRTNCLKKIGDCCTKFNRFYVLLTRDITLVLRKYIWLVTFLLLPAIYLLLFCASIGTTPHSLPVGIVNYEVTGHTCDDPEMVSCRLLRSLNKHIIHTSFFDSTEEAFRAAENLEILGILIINKTTSKYFYEFFGNLLLGRLKQMGPPPFKLHLDRTSKIVANTIERNVRHAIDFAIADFKDRVDFDIGQFLLIGTPLFGLEKTENVEGLAPGVALSFTFHSITFVIGVIMVKNWQNAIPARNYLAGVKIEEEVLSYMLVAGFITFLQAILMYNVMLFLFGMSMIAHFGNVILIVIFQIICGISFGVHWPIESLPLWLYILSSLLPCTKSVEAICTVLQRNTQIDNEVVWMGLLVPFCWTIFFTIFYTFRYKISEI
ncbi:hypothetical protein RI129_005890 [Pyrocoelia pectoralis]|uniref:ABC transporter domain-containing protein n=1 Tax=Pyrocoelia pectoralis TaxID=417401 RepID=A0AAN7V9R4_9COLE